MFRIVKKNPSFNSEKINWTMLLLIGGFILLVFLILYPLIKKESFKSFNTMEKFAKLVENVTDYTVDAGCGIPKSSEEKKEDIKVETMADVQSTTKMTASGDLTPANSSEISNENKVDTMACSKACCSPQWGIENTQDDRVMPNDLGNKFFPTNYMCNGENPGDHGNGCVCVNKNGFDNLGFRGGNNTF